MEKLKMQTVNKADENFKKLSELFPNAVTETINEEGEIIRAIDKDILMQEINTKVVEAQEERYQFIWPDKKKAILLANAPISKTLRPCREESVNFDTTENLYIEGDNLEVLKLLQETYLGKVKMIYIDPPYNTGNNLIYKNDFSMSTEEYLSNSGQYTDEGQFLVQNLDSNGRFHTDWLNMIFARLRVSKNLLMDEGYIAIAIDDNEVYNLKKIVDEVFGECNYIGTIVTRCNPQGRNKNNIDPVHEYHLVYAKNFLKMPLLKIKKETTGQQYGYLMRSGTNSRKYERPNRFYPMLVKDRKVFVIEEDEYKRIYSPENGFDEEHIINLKEKYEKLGYNFVLPISKDGEEKVWQRVYERVKKECGTYIYEKGQIKVPSEDYRTPISLWSEEKYSNVSYGTNRLKNMFDNKIPFDFSKSIFTVKDLISLNTNNNTNDIIIDFFPGSATTADAVMTLNLEDDGNRRFIMVQLPENVDEKTVSYEMGNKTICDIGKKRIIKAGEKIKEKNENIDIGFRVLKCDTSNMKDVYYNPSQYQNLLFDSLENNIKEGRTSEDLLFQVMLDLGVLLSSKIEKKIIAGKKVFNVEDNYLIACFDENVTEETIEAIAKQKPYYFVMRDSSMANDSVATNFEQIFATYSPDTIRRVL
ncbi:MAG: site-specific DNA-methyltransferase [Fusobacterium varium]|uniref:site-specific DNA-methyltransferase n=1 Tax=Fusobacterium varium TaxID=856 RepID=UPI00242E65D1|nr:site-specific DNA-methyltransferase [Fusobacterium varium]MCF0171842.1 site-specific DNA-methyltransferase [Fusobacterium varium]